MVSDARSDRNMLVHLNMDANLSSSGEWMRGVDIQDFAGRRQRTLQDSVSLPSQSSRLCNKVGEAVRRKSEACDTEVASFSRWPSLPLRM
jgi:hypothetical protein